MRFWLILIAALPVWAWAAEQDANVQKLQNGILAAESKPGDKTAPAYRTNFPLALLQLKKAKLLGEKSWFGGGTAEDCAKKGLAALDRLARGETYQAEKGKLDELAYVTECDGTVQPYYLHLPANYDPAKKWPLIVFLHGYVPSTSVIDPWILSEEVCQIATDNGCILLIPYGRRNTDFQGVGEVDVLAATEEVKALYSVDPLRVYMSGVSMGGMGAWNMALRHPGMYAAATPMSGQTDMHTWWQRVVPTWPKSRDDIPPFRRFLVEWDNPIDLVMNARNQPMFVQHGELDSLIPVEQSRTMVAAAAALDVPIKLFEFKGASHYIYWDLPCFKNAWGWEKDFTLNESPTRVTYKTYSLKYDTAFWVQIADLVEWGKPATVDCEVVRGGKGLQIKTENVRLLKIDVQKAPLQKVEDFTATVNGKRQRVRATANWDLYVVCDGKEIEERAWPPHKRKGLCGPVESVFDTAFLMVPGTAGEAEANRENAEHAKRWAEDWDQFADGLPPMKLDSEVTAQDIATHNLVLFGTPASNSVLAKIAGKLPIKIGEQKYTVAGKTYQGDDLGLVMCYPNPLAPEHYVAIYAGKLYGEKCGINHKHDLLPDFIVFNTRHFNYDDTNEHEVAGWFGTGWEISEGTSWVRGRGSDVMDMLTRIVVSGFKSIREMALQLGPLNVLIGANGSGKSNLVSFFKMLKDISKLQEFVAREGGADPLLHYGAKVTHDIHASLTLELGGRQTDHLLHLAFAKPATLMPVGRVPGEREVHVVGRAGTQKLRTPGDFLRQIRCQHLNDTSDEATARQQCYFHDNRELGEHGENLAAVLYMLRETRAEYYQRIVSTVRLATPFFDDFELEPLPLNPNNLLLQWRERGRDTLFGPHQLSDGTLRMMALVTLLLQPEDKLPSLIIIDEPELGLHPYAIEIIASLLESASVHTQVIVATQSVSLVDRVDPSTIVVVDRHEGASTFRRLAPDELNEWLGDYSLGELWEKNVIGGRPAR